VVDRHVVVARLAKIREYVALLRKIRGLATESQFVADPIVYGSAERYLQLAIQAVLDISNHLLADLKLGLPADNRELFDQLARHKIVSVPLSRKLTRMAGFRNLLVHEYMEIDRRRVYAVLRRELGDFETFIRAVSRRL
jgi:uncharacterized protein YutE (UPF0331/DUF86 family)